MAMGQFDPDPTLDAGAHIAQAQDPAFQSFWIGRALSSGIARADIDNFIHENGPQDLPSILSRLSPSAAPSTSPGPGTGALSYSAALQAADVYATPTTQQSGVGLITQGSAADGRMTGVGSGRDVIVQGDAASSVTVAPSSGIPTWALIAAAVLVILLLTSDRS